MNARYIITLIISMLWALSACKKEPEKRFSVWYVNQDTFRTNNTRVSVSRVELYYSDGNRPTYFQFVFKSSFYSYPVHYLSKKPWASMDAGFIVNDTVVYHPSITPQTAIVVEKINDKAHFIMPPTWCLNHANANDSVLVGGSFWEP